MNYTKNLLGKQTLIAGAGGDVYTYVLPTLTGTSLPNAIDNQVIEEVYIICNTTAGTLNIYLPAISSFKNAWNCKLYITLEAGSNPVVIHAYNNEIEVNTLNGYPFVTEAVVHDTYYMHIVSDTSWMSLKCPGNAL